MSEQNKSEGTSIVPSQFAAISIKPSRLIQRGLHDLSKLSVTPEQIDLAWKERREFRGLSNDTVKIALEKPEFWEYTLFLRTLIDEVENYESLRQA